VAQSSVPDPANSREVTDIEYERLSARFSDDGVYGDPTDPAVVTPGTGLSVNVRADVAASVRGHGWYSGGTATSVPLPANVASQPRIDWIVLRLNRDDWTVRADKVVGTPGSGVPALTQQTGDTGVWEIPLAQARVLGGASSVTVSRAELYVGTRTRVCTSTTRNPNPRLGEHCFETDTGIERVWTGQSWRALFDESPQLPANYPLQSWRISADTVLEAKNGSAHLRLGSFERTGGSVSGEVRLPVNIPTKYRHPNRGQYAIAYLTGSRIGRLEVYAANTDRPGQVWLTQFPPLAKGDYVMPGSGISWVVL